MRTLNLNGHWTAHFIGKPGGKLARPLPGNAFRARVPGDVHTDLLREKLIPDPFYRDNELELQWIGRQGFSYQRDFTVTNAMLAEDCIELQCDGLDTLATVLINGTVVATTENMFRAWRWDVKSLVHTGTNSIEIRFAPALTYLEQKDFGRHLASWGDIIDSKVSGHAKIRKEQCNFGWDWGIKAATCGIWQDIRLCAFSTARAEAVLVSQTHAARQVQLDIRVPLKRLCRGKLTVRAQLSLAGTPVANASVSSSAKAPELCLQVTRPKLWWPNGMGEQTLYELSVEVLDTEGGLLDTQQRQLGLRTLEVDRHDDEWGQSFQFTVNGIPFFAKGGNWIPVDAIMGRRRPDMYRQLLEDCAHAHMNMLRVWGGGIYEDAVFYETCDRLGICVWQDFMFACSAQPSFDRGFMNNVAAEARDQVARLQHHACIALWCGNNEIEGGRWVGDRWTPKCMSWADYKKLFDQLLPQIVSELHPDASYCPASPHTPAGDRSHTGNTGSGDVHLWRVWHGQEPFEWYRECPHRFVSEFGFQSFPEPKTIATFTESEDRNLTSYIMEHHQRSRGGNAIFMRYMLEWFQLPSGFDNTVWVSQILQGIAIKIGVEHWRRMMPRTMGALYWQINDVWPVASWSSIDYFGRWKAMHYMAKRFFAPVLLSAVEDGDKGTVEVHVTSDRLKAQPATVTWTATDASGKKLDSGSKQLRTPLNGNRKALALQLASLLKQQGERDLIVWLSLKTTGEADQHNLVIFGKPKHLKLRADPGITSTLQTRKDGSFVVRLKARHVALWTWLELDGVDAKFSDNFVHLRPGQQVRITMQPAKSMSLSEVKKRLIVRNLSDLS